MFESASHAFWKSKRWAVRIIALLIVTAGSLAVSQLELANEAGATGITADAGDVFELRICHVLPGRMQALETRFRDQTSKLLAKHDLKVIGYWIDVSENTFVFLVDHRSREDAKKNWDAMIADPGIQDVVKAEQAYNTVEKVDTSYMHPTDFSPMK